MSNENNGDPGKPKTEAVAAVAKHFFRERADVVARIRQMTGRNYPNLENELGNLTRPALMDLVRFVSDAQQEVTRAKRQAIHEPWRR